MRKFIALSAIAALTTSAFAAEDLSAKIADLESQLKALNAKVNEVKAHDANDNIKWDVNFRTSMDNIQYKLANGGSASNPDLLTNRLWLNMGYAVDQNNVFKGTLSYNKAYGDSMNHSQANTNPGFADFDWVTNENANGNELKVKEAYWLYMNDTFLGTEHPWTASFGRRPSTDGLGISIRDNAEAKSPLAHTVNVEFDGASFKFDNLLPTPGDSFKICLGRGLTNASPRFDMFNPAYAANTNTTALLGPTASHTKDVDMYGFIFVPYDNGQYSVSTNWARADHLIGFTQSSMNNFNAAWALYTSGGAYDFNRDGDTSDPGESMTGAGNLLANLNSNMPAFSDVGSIELATAMFKAEGIGSGISAYLDDTKLFASYAMSKTHPNANGMLGSTESKTGQSYWIGINAPCPLTADGRWGVEWNKGSKYWRPVTYAEDTMVGSKIAARGTALEAYYIKPLTKALTGSLRATQIKYDYTGSNSFFGADGAPMTMDQAVAAGMNPVKEATDVRVAVTYKF
jgi:hypothetical protein